jgi:hypothetical protein
LCNPTTWIKSRFRFRRIVSAKRARLLRFKTLLPFSEVFLSLPWNAKYVLLALALPV